MRIRILNKIIVDSAKYAFLRSELRMETYQKILPYIYKIKKLRQGFYLTDGGQLLIGYIRSDSNFHYMTADLLEHCGTHSACDNLKPIDFQEGIELWSKLRRKTYDALLKNKGLK